MRLQSPRTMPYPEEKDFRCSALQLIVTMVFLAVGLFGCGGGNSPAGFQAGVVAASLTGPTAIAFAPDGRLFICEKTGAVKVVKGNQLPVQALKLNVSTNMEQGLTGIVFDPDFASNKHLYLYYTTNGMSLNPLPSPRNRLSRFTVSGDSIDPTSETILTQDIASDTGIHNAGCLRFGPDGKLYVSVGDGGVRANAQDLSNLNGKILRINKDGSVPADNPFAGQVGKRGEIYAYGLRNPFRFTIRAGDNALVIGDVGQDTWEEVNVGGAGANFGWPVEEGLSTASGFVAPVHAYNHNGSGASITGGVFLSSVFPQEYRGQYLYADFILGKLWRVDLKADNTVGSVTEFGPTEGLSAFTTSIVDIEQGPDGDLYLVDFTRGFVFRINYS
jgi:glucose/arabinose dehydrogenase